MQKYFLKNPPPPPNFSLVYLKKHQVDGCEIPGSERGIRAGDDHPVQDNEHQNFFKTSERKKKKFLDRNFQLS